MAQRTTFFKLVGRKVREMREKCGETLSELSIKSNIPENTLKSIEWGKRDMKISELFRISKALNVRISSFLNPCDSKFYERRKEEAIKPYVSLKNLSQILNISPSSIRALCKNKEIPHCKI